MRCQCRTCRVITAVGPDWAGAKLKSPQLSASAIMDLLPKHVADTFKGLKAPVINIPQAESANAQHGVSGHEHGSAHILQRTINPA